MLVVFHVIIALFSILYSAYTFFSPSKQKINVSLCLVIATLISGTYLVFSTHANMASACTSGLTYLGIVTTALCFADYRLILQNIKKHIVGFLLLKSRL
jgi:RsiW-degrading membrane proteinase PrsW (M82 family)